MPAPKREYCCCEEDGAFLKERPFFADPPSQGGRRNAAPTKNMRKPKASPPQWGGGPLAVVGHPFRTATILAVPLCSGGLQPKTLGNERMRAGCAGAKLRVFVQAAKKERSSVPLLEAVSNREPGNGLFWRRISGTNEPTASQCLRKINLSLAASLKSAKVRQPARSAVGRFAGVAGLWRKPSGKSVAQR